MTSWTRMLDDIASGSADPPPFVRVLRLPPIDGWEPNRVWGTWKVDPEMFHAGGALFGGYMSALADSAVGLVMMTVLTDNEWFTTADLRISFFRPVIRGTLAFDARVVNRGRRMAHCEVVLTNDDDKMVAKATATQVIQPVGE